MVRRICLTYLLGKQEHHHLLVGSGGGVLTEPVLATETEPATETLLAAVTGLVTPDTGTTLVVVTELVTPVTETALMMVNETVLATATALATATSAPMGRNQKLDKEVHQ